MSYSVKLKPSYKKWLLLVLGGSLLVLCLTRLTTAHPTHSSNPTEGSSSAALTTQATTANQDRDSKPGKSWTRAAHGDASRRVITHQGADFAKGEQANTVVNDALQMGDDPTFIYELEPGRLFGVYLSPEETTLESFDTLIARYDVTTPENSALNWAFRIKPESGGWSDWQEVSTEDLNRPIRLDTPGLGWQYRLTFYSYSAAASPQVRRVTVTTLRSDPMQLSMNPSAPSSPQTTPPRQNH